MEHVMKKKTVSNRREKYIWSLKGKGDTSTICRRKIYGLFGTSLTDCNGTNNQICSHFIKWGIFSRWLRRADVNELIVKVWCPSPMEMASLIVTPNSYCFIHTTHSNEIVDRVIKHYSIFVTNRILYQVTLLVRVSYQILHNLPLSIWF